jgi:hypothetical protein
MGYRDELVNEGHRIEEDSLWSAKCHFCSAEILKWLHLGIGIPAVFVMTLAAALPKSDITQGATVTFLAAIGAVLSGLIAFLNPKKEGQRHHGAGNEYIALRNKGRIFSSLEAPYIDEGQAKTLLDRLSAERDKLNRESPNILRPAYWWARRGIAGGQANHQVDKEAPEKG